MCHAPALFFSAKGSAALFPALCFASGLDGLEHGAQTAKDYAVYYVGDELHAFACPHRGLFGRAYVCAYYYACVSRLPNDVGHGVEQERVVVLKWNAQRLRKVGGTDKEHVNARHGENFGQVFYAFDAFNSDDDQWLGV